MLHWNVCTRSRKRSRVHTTLDITGPAGVVLHLSNFSQPTDTSENKNVGLLHREPMSNFTVRVCVISFPAPPCSLSEGERGNRELQTKYEKTHSSEAVWRVCEKVEDRVQEMDTLKRGKEEDECVWWMCVCLVECSLTVSWACGESLFVSSSFWSHPQTERTNDRKKSNWQINSLVWGRNKL